MSVPRVNDRLAPDPDRRSELSDRVQESRRAVLAQIESGVQDWRLAARLRAAGDDVQERYYPKLNHAKIIGAVSPLLGFLAPVLPDCLTFIHAVTSTQKLRSAA